MRRISVPEISNPNYNNCTNITNILIYNNKYANVKMYTFCC